MGTYFIKGAEIKRNWHLIDAKNIILGKLAVEAAKYLTGKHKVQYSPSSDVGDFVVVINASTISVTGKKKEDKMYYRHSQYPGGFKSVSLGKMLVTQPEKVIKHAVKGMLPQNKLGRLMIRRLHIYPGEKHPHQSQIGKSTAPTIKNKEN